MRLKFKSFSIIQIDTEDYYNTVASTAGTPDVVNYTSLICLESTAIGKTGAAENYATEDDIKI